MSEAIRAERKAEILAAIKDGNKTVAVAGQEFHIAPSTIRRWIKKKVDNAGSSSTEMQRLRKENQLLKEMLADHLLEKALAKKR